MGDRGRQTPELTPRFERLESAGKGGSGQVWRARDRRDGLEIALKVAHREEGRRALAREAGYAALALSPRLPELVDAGHTGADGAPWGLDDRLSSNDIEPAAYVALRWAPGAPLSAVPRSDAAARVALALAVAADVGEALADLHALGIAHGDVKPQNLIIDPGGRVRVIDLGLACHVHARAIEGATLRYLATGDADRGDARARDLVALGAVLSEIADDDVARSASPIEAARRATLPSALGAICSALLAPSPGARPSASWVSDAARSALLSRGEGDTRASDEGRAERDARLVRATYLRLRRSEIDAGMTPGSGTSPWLGDAIARLASARSLSAGSADGGTIEPLSAEGVARWLTTLAGSAVASWPLSDLVAAGEPALCRGLEALARRLPPLAWSLHDVEAAVSSTAPEIVRDRTTFEEPGAMTASLASRLALAVAAVPPDPAAIAAIERRADAPSALVVAAADALRLRGELGRARSLVLRGGACGPEADALAVEVLRRAGDLDRADARGRDVIARGADVAGRALASVARVAIDRGQLDEAEALLANAAPSPALCEARALLATLRHDVPRAIAEVARGEALARSAEERGRLSAMRGYALHAEDPARACDAYQRAVEDAVRAGAVVEEATYRTGEAAAAADLGDIARALESARRAALLWEHLGRPAHAARARLARAAAFATAGAAHEARRAARDAVASAQEAGDVRAEAYAWWAIADVEIARSPAGIAAARRADALLDPHLGTDALQAAARLLDHDPSSLSRDRRGELDGVAHTATASGAARLAWWGARAREIVHDRTTGASVERSDVVLSAITALAAMPAPVASRGPALAAGSDLAALDGRGEVVRRLLVPLADAARALLAGAPSELVDGVRALPWVIRAAAAPEAGMRPEQARDLEALVRSLGEREHLATLLGRVVDALILWTGVERGLLLLRAPDGRLVPRAARNLARADLTGEQLTLSRSLAMRALEAGEPVVAVDAAGERADVQDSIHALKLRSVLAVPLIARGDALGVVYLDDRVRRGAFGPTEIGFARTAASIAALAIADARDQVLLRRAARTARRASQALAESLAQREAALDVAERELAKVREGRSTRFRYDRIAGESEPVAAMLRVVDRVTTADVPVLLVGESGSGKELVARAIHDNGPRGRRSFVSENCGAIPEGLLESALFGHVRGAFTGADRPRAGLFEVADGGTLFLDEVGEMSLGMQAKLLRVLEDGIVHPVGSDRSRKVDVRVLTATHRDLEAMVQARTFREDLLYRLNIVTIRVPPLRERPGDIPLLVQRFIALHGKGERVRLTPAAMDRLASYAWPGNVRQLENETRRAIVLSDGVIDREHLSPDVAGQARTGAKEAGLCMRERIDALETDLVREALKRTGHNQTQAAKLLGLSRFGLQKMIKRLGIV